MIEITLEEGVYEVKTIYFDEFEEPRNKTFFGNENFWCSVVGMSYIDYYDEKSKSFRFL